MEALDRLRTSYSSLPGPIRMLAGTIAGIVPPTVRLGGSFQSQRRQVENAARSSSFAKSYQTKRLQALRERARRSPYWRNVFDAVGFLSSNGLVLDNLPILTREILVERREELLTCRPSDADLVYTSGSSGQPVGVYLDKDRSVREWAFITHIWSNAGFRISDRRAVIRGFDLPSKGGVRWQYDRGLRELRLSAFDLSSSSLCAYLELIANYRVQFLQGYPSALSALAREAIARGISLPSVRGVLPVSEPLLAFQRRELDEAFSSPIVPFYGQTEKVAIADEIADNPGRYKFNPCYGITEILDDGGAPVMPGDRGRLVSTGLVSFAMPLFRYDTGDSCVLLERPSPENGFQLVVDEISPRRAQEYLVKECGSIVSMAAINLHSPSLAMVREFQFMQELPGKALLKVVLRDRGTGVDADAAVREMQAKVGAGLELSYAIVPALTGLARGKRRYVDQRITTNGGV